MKRNFSRLLPLFFLAPVFSFAQRSVPTAVSFLTLGPDARAGAMGETGATNRADANSIHWNGAKLVFAQKRTGMSVSYKPWLRSRVPDAHFAYASFYTKPNEKQAIGASVRYFTPGEFTMFSASGVIGKFRPVDLAVDGCYSRKLNEHFSMAAAVRYIRSNLYNGISIAGMDTRIVHSMSVDLGGFYRTGSKTVFGKTTFFSSGIALTNMGRKVSSVMPAQYEFIPANLRLGEGMVMLISSKQRLDLQLEVNKMLVPSQPVYATGANGSLVIPPVIIAGKDPNVNAAQGMAQSFYDAPDGFEGELKECNLNVGVEYRYMQLVAARCGFVYLSPETSVVSVGAGVYYDAFGLDFVYYLPVNAMRNIQQQTLGVTLSCNVDSFRRVKKTE